MPPTVAISSYSFHRLFLAGEANLVDDAATLARTVGADAIEFALGSPLSPTPDKALLGRLAERCDAAGLPICSVVVSADLLRGKASDRSAAVDSVIDQLEAAHSVGVSCFRHDASLGPDGDDLSDGAFAEALPILATSCRQIAERAGELGMHSSVENHGRFVQHADRVARLIEVVDHPAFGVTQDVGNSLFADQDHVEAAGLLAPHAITVHMKDFVINPRSDSLGGGISEGDIWPTWPGGPSVIGCALGEGDVDLRGCVEAIRGAGFEGAWVVEFEGPVPDPKQGAAIGLRVLRGLLETSPADIT